MTQQVDYKKKLQELTRQIKVHSLKIATNKMLLKDQGLELSSLKTSIKEASRNASSGTVVSLLTKEKNMRRAFVNYTTGHNKALKMERKNMYLRRNKLIAEWVASEEPSSQVA